MSEGPRSVVNRFAMTQVPHEAAIAYVTAQERHYEGAGPTKVLKVEDKAEDDFVMVIVTTEIGEWGIWYEPDGSIYGEW